MAPVFFESAAQFRDWLERHHGSADAIVLGLVRVSSGLTGTTHAAALDEALCFGWIDGVVRRIDDQRFAVRFTPRRPRSYWSAVNLRRYAELDALGRVAAPGRAAFERRAVRPTSRYSFEHRPMRLSPALARRFKAAADAWTFFSSQPPGYRRTATFWVMSAVKDETRERRLDRLIQVSSAGRRIDLLAPARTPRPTPRRRLARGAPND